MKKITNLQNTLTMANSTLSILNAYDEKIDAQITFKSRYCQDNFSTIAIFSSLETSLFKT